MKAEQQMTIRKYLGRCEFDDDEFFAAVDAFDADLRAMRTPITAKELEAAGWRATVVVGRTATYKSDRILTVSVLLSDGEHCTTYVQYDSNHEVPAWECNTMYDLGELVRLLGGVK